MRGLHDGFRIGNEEGMTPAKHKMLLKQQTAVAQKVYEHVTSVSAITANGISSSIIREAQFRVDMKTLTGILDSLKDCGLIKEAPRGQFIRVIPREQTPFEALKANEQTNDHTLTIKREILPGSADGSIKAVTSAEQRELADAAGDPSASPAEKFGDLAVSLRLKANSLMKLADEMDEAALEFEQQVEDSRKRLERFNALRALLTEA